MEYAKYKVGEKLSFPVYAFDNAPIHKAALKDYPDLIPKGHQLPVPRYSPDFNRAIEHNHAHVEDLFYKAVEALPQGVRLSCRDAMLMLNDIFFQHTNASSIAKDVGGMPTLWEKVVKLEGQYPPKKYM